MTGLNNDPKILMKMMTDDKQLSIQLVVFLLYLKVDLQT